MKLKMRMDMRFVLVLSVLALVVLGYLIYSFVLPKPILAVSVNGNTVIFRDDLREADKIPIYPDANSISKFFASSSVTNITFAFKPMQGDNGLDLLEESEIIFKTTLLYSQYGYQPTYKAVPVQDYSQVNSTSQDPTIVFVSPSFANETSVRLVNSTVYISGKSAREFDLATIKFMMTVLGIKL